MFVKSSEWPSGRDSVYRSSLSGPKMSHARWVNCETAVEAFISVIANVLTVSTVKCIFTNTKF